MKSESDFRAFINTDQWRRGTALHCAVLRAGQDGGLEGGFDVLALADLYNSWIKTGNTDLRETPVLEKIIKEGEDESQ